MSRKNAQDYILKYIDKLMPNSENRAIYETLFSNMDDEDFAQFMDDLETGKKTLSIIAPNFGKESLSTERNLAIAKEIGHEFFQRIWIEGDDEVPTYLTPIPYLVIDLPLRRQAQLLVKKISIPEDNKSVDDFTGQPTGKSKGARVSYPEVQVLAAMGLDNSLVELLKYRGGDVKGFDAMNDAISKQGGVSMKAIEKFTSGVESTRILKSYLTAMHIKSTLSP